MAGELERRRREAGQCVEREAHHLLERIFGLAGEALCAVVGERHLPEADPRDHAADEARLLGHREQCVERAAAHQPEVAGVERDVDLGRAREQPVKAVRRCPLERRFAGAALAHAIDHVAPRSSHRRNHRRKQLGRILEVGVDDQDRRRRGKDRAPPSAPAGARDCATG